jgi:hypothetical protein
MPPEVIHRTSIDPNRLRSLNGIQNSMRSPFYFRRIEETRRWGLDGFPPLPLTEPRR